MLAVSPDKVASGIRMRIKHSLCCAEHLLLNVLTQTMSALAEQKDRAQNVKWAGSMRIVHACGPVCPPSGP